MVKIQDYLNILVFTLGINCCDEIISSLTRLIRGHDRFTMRNDISMTVGNAITTLPLRKVKSISEK